MEHSLRDGLETPGGGGKKNETPPWDRMKAPPAMWGTSSSMRAEGLGSILEFLKMGLVGE